MWNKLEVFMVPEVLSNLNRLERVLISRRILFKKVIAPKGKFLKLKGSICNVPIDTADIVNVLPRGTVSNGLVVVKLKRKLCYRGHVYFESVIPELVYQALTYLKENNTLRKIFPRVIFLISNLPEKRFRMFKKKAEIDELPGDSTDIFQHDMLDHYLDRPNENFKNGEYKIIDQLCFAEFLSLYYVDAKQIEISENDSEPVVLNDELMDSNHEESICPKIVSLMSSKEKLKCRKVKAVLRYHQPSPIKMLNNKHIIFYLLFIHFVKKKN